MKLKITKREKRMMDDWSGVRRVEYLVEKEKRLLDRRKKRRAA